jgi:nicotinamidase-related amidase
MTFETLVGRPALLVIDMQGDFVSRCPEGQDIITPINALIAAFRVRRLPIIFTREMHRPDGIDGGLESDPRYKVPPHTVIGTPGAEIVAQTALRPEDPIVDKRRYNCFLGTELGLLLHTLRVETLVITGMDSDICVHWTAGEAYQYDYHVRVPEDCVASPRPDGHAASLLILRGLVSRGRALNSGEILAALEEMLHAAG